MPYISDYDVLCAFCHHHQKHRRGWLVETADGRRALCGIDCAEKFFGPDVVRKMKTELDRLDRRIDRQRIVGPLIDGVPEVLRELDYWIPLEVEVESALSGLWHATFNPDGPARLNPSVTEAGTIDRVVVSNFETEERRADGTSRVRKHEHCTILGRVHGAAVLTMQGRSFVKAQRKLSLISEKTETSKLDDPILRHLVEVRRQTVECLSEGIQRCELAARFFQRPNIEELGRWFEQEDPAIRLRWVIRKAGEHAIAISNSRWHGAEVSVPDLADLPTRERLISPLLGRPKEAVA